MKVNIKKHLDVLDPGAKGNKECIESKHIKSCKIECSVFVHFKEATWFIKPSFNTPNDTFQCKTKIKMKTKRAANRSSIWCSSSSLWCVKMVRKPMNVTECLFDIPSVWKNGRENGYVHKSTHTVHLSRTTRLLSIVICHIYTIYTMYIYSFYKKFQPSNK